MSYLHVKTEPDKLTAKIRALDQRTMLNIRAWLADENGKDSNPPVCVHAPTRVNLGKERPTFL